MKPIKFNGYTVTLSEGGFLDYVYYECRHDLSRERVAGGEISRMSYVKGPRGDKAHRAAIKKECLRASEAFEKTYRDRLSRVP